MTTNATNETLANLLSEMPVGRFVGLITTKKGKLIGRGANRRRYGDDEVHVVLFTGFRYPRLVERSRDRALEIGAEALLAECQRRGRTGKSGTLITLEDCNKGLAAFVASCERTLDGTSKSTTEHVYEPLTVEGEIVRGCRVYTGPGNPTDAKTPLPGTIYLQGLKIGERVITPAVNGRIPVSNSRGDVVAKSVLRSMVPLGRYVSYALEPGTGYMLKAGQAAISQATTTGVQASGGAESQVRSLLG